MRKPKRQNPKVEDTRINDITLILTIFFATQNPRIKEQPTRI